MPVMIETAVVYSLLIAPTVLGAAYVGEIAYDQGTITYTATACAGAAGNAARADGGTQSGGETIANKIFAANQASLLPNGSSIAITWNGTGSNSVATVTITVSKQSYLGQGISLSSAASG